MKARSNITIAAELHPGGGIWSANVAPGMIDVYKAKAERLERLWRWFTSLPKDEQDKMLANVS